MAFIHCTFCHRDLSTNEIWCRYLVYFLCYTLDKIMMDRQTDGQTGRLHGLMGQTDGATAIYSPVGSTIIIHAYMCLIVSILWSNSIFLPRKLFFVSFLEPVKDFRNLDALLRKFLRNGAVDMVYMIGFTAEFNGRMKTATQANTCNRLFFNL